MKKLLPNIQVISPHPSSTHGQLRAGNMSFPCALGRSGTTDTKREGDGATPVGTWPLRELLYRADRIAEPECTLTCSIIRPQHGWCDDPESTCYNQKVNLPFEGSHEDLWRQDRVYDIIVPLGYNDDPPQKGRGSAIFFHIADPDYGPTQGCVAISLKDMCKVLKQCGPDTVMII